MKKLMSLLLALLLTVALACPALADSNELEMDTTLLDAFDYSVDEWTASEYNRAVFATMAMLDAIMTDNELAYDIAVDALTNNVIYVAREANIVSCFLFGEETCLMILYYPGDGAAAAFVSLSDDLALGLMAALKSDGDIITYWQVEGTDVQAMLQIAIDVLSE